jgi:hypothetical protein
MTICGRCARSHYAANAVLVKARSHRMCRTVSLWAMTWKSAAAASEASGR